MVTQEAIQGKWHEIKGKLHDRWGQLNDDELERAQGNVEQLVGTIQRKTGAAREEIERYLEDAASTGAARGQQVVEAASRYAHVASEQLHESTRQAMDAAHEGYVEAQRFVRSRPFESLATCFGIGLVTGVVVGLMLRSK
jgi:uncharacterized protein YjbJ (UPF0337 family)